MKTLLTFLLDFIKSFADIFAGRAANRRQAIEEMRRTNDEMVIKLADLYKKVIEQNETIVRLTTALQETKAELEQQYKVIAEIKSKLETYESKGKCKNK